MSEENNEAFANFVAITGASEDRAKFFMESSNWNLDVALVNFYEMKDGETSEESSSREDRPTVSQPSTNSAPKKPEKKSVIKSTGNVRTLSNLKPDQDSGESSDEEEGQAFYAGGSEHSGQQVLGPPRGRRADIVSDMFRSVRAFGAEVVEPQSSSSRGRQATVFGGTGYRLGETSDDTQAVAAKKAEDNSLFEITLKFWKNGFSVNDGPLRSYDDPKSQEILHHIKHGEIPNELIMQAEGREISFNLEDYRHSEYVGSNPKTASFSGAGQKLGSVTPTLSSPSPASDNSSSREDSAAQPNPVEVDNSRPTTNIQIRLADGSRLVGTFNHDHTINDIRRYINASSPSSRERGYILLSSFPRKELVNNEETIEQAGLISSVVMQHLVAVEHKLLNRAYPSILAMLVQEPVQAAIWNCLNHYDFADAIFLAERLRAEVDSDETLFLLATCYYRAGKKMQAYSALRSRKLNSSKCKFLMAKCCVDLEKIPEAELVLTGGDATRFQTVEDVVKEYGEESAFVLQIIGRIYYKSERTTKGADALRKSLKVCPYLWQSFKELCDHGEKPDPTKIFQVGQVETPPNCQSFNAGYNNYNGHVENVIFNSNNSSTPVQTLGIISCNSMSGIRQFTPEDGQYSLLRPTAASKPSKYRNLYGLSPLTASFGVLPLETSPSESYVISPTGTLTENSDQKIIAKRQLLGRKEPVTPLQVSKPVVFNQSGNTTLVTNTPNIPPPAPLQTVRRSSRIVTNNSYNVKENSKSPKFASPKSPSRKAKSIRVSKSSKSTFSELNEKNKLGLEPDGGLSMQNACQQVLALQKQSMEGLMALLGNFGKAYLYLAHYDLNRAIESFLDLPMPQQNTPLVLSYCGKAHVELHQYKEAVRYFEKVREKEPYRDTMMEIYSTALWFLHKEKDLSALAHDLLQCDRYSPSTWCAAGNCVSLHKEHDVAIKFFERAVQLDPDFAYAHTLLGHEYVVTEELDKAATCFRHAIRVDPRHYNAWYGLGSIYIKQEKYQLAEIHFKKALAIHPTSTVIMCIIGVVQNALQKPYTALDTFNEALQINPKSAVCKFHRASLYYNSGRYQEALAELQELQGLVPKESSVFYLTAKVHKKLGNDHLTSMYISWGTDLDPKGANSQVREASDLLINHSVVPDIGGVLSPSEQPIEAASVEGAGTPADVSLLDPVDMDETL